MILLSKEKKIAFPYFSQTLPGICVILNACLLIIVQSKKSATPLGFLTYLDISHSAISTPPGSTHLLPVTSQLLAY